MTDPHHDIGRGAVISVHTPSPCNQGLVECTCSTKCNQPQLGTGCTSYIGRYHNIYTGRRGLNSKKRPLDTYLGKSKRMKGLLIPEPGVCTDASCKAVFVETVTWVLSVLSPL